MNQYSYEMTNAVLKVLNELPEGLHKKVDMYLGMLEAKGFYLFNPYVDKIESYKNLWELRPSFANLEFRMIFYWQERTARFIHAFYERGKKKKNQREYQTADMIRNEMIKRRRPNETKIMVLEIVPISFKS